jgi:hypothetical protein
VPGGGWLATHEDVTERVRAEERITCHSACNIGSDAILVQSRSRGADETGLKQVQLGTPVHLTLNELEFGDLALGLSVGP